VPEIAPVEVLMDRPVGRPAADQVYGVLPPLADIDCDTAVPFTLARVPGLVTAGAVPVVHVNEAPPVNAALSRTVTLDENVPAAVGVPEMTPLEALIAKPVGSPVADQLYGEVPPVAVTVRLTARFTPLY
jgi:hypothetical protein